MHTKTIWLSAHHEGAVDMAELARVLKPGGRLVAGELFGDPHWVGRS
jgi:ubiquinone/menaquinone biosynthesis C-methylase UbiE